MNVSIALLVSLIEPAHLKVPKSEILVLSRLALFLCPYFQLRMLGDTIPAQGNTVRQGNQYIVPPQ